MSRIDSNKIIHNMHKLINIKSKTKLFFPKIGFGKIENTQAVISLVAIIE